MDLNDDNSLFTFINNLTSIPLQEKEDDADGGNGGGEQALVFARNSSSSSEQSIITSGANSGLTAPNSLSFHSSSTASENNHHHHHQHLLLKKKFKGLNISGDSSASDGLGSTATSEKSSSEGGCSSAEGSSICSVTEQQQHQQAAAHVESILSPLIGMVAGGAHLIPHSNNHNSPSTAVVVPPAAAMNSLHHQQQSAAAGRESSESPASSSLHNQQQQHQLHSLQQQQHHHHFFGGFQTSSNSNSSSPPLSQPASGASSSSASSGVLGGCLSTEGALSRNGSGGFQPLLSTSSTGDNFSVFNNLASKIAFNSVQLSPGKGSEGSSSNSFCSSSNPLDSMFSSFLNGSGSSNGGRGSTIAEGGAPAPVVSFSSMLESTVSFPPSSAEHHRRQFASPQNGHSAQNNSSSNSGNFSPLLPTTNQASIPNTNNCFSNPTAQENSYSAPAPPPLLPLAFFPSSNLSTASSSPASFSPFSGSGSKLGEGGVDFINSGPLQHRKAFSSLFNGGGSVSANNHNNSTSSTSPIISSGGGGSLGTTPTTPLMLSAGGGGTTSFFGTFDGSSSNNSGSPYLLNNNQSHDNSNNSHHLHHQMMSGNGQPQQLTNSNSNNSNNLSSTTMQARFEAHIRSLANEINSTVQLYTNNLEIRKEQLIKQLDHVRNTYLLLLKQHQQNSGTKGASGGAFAFPRIHFVRPETSHLKVATSFGHLNSPAFAPYCHATGDGLSVAVEGEPACFVVATRNCFNDEMLIGGENVEVEIQAIESNAQSHHQQQHHQNGYQHSTAIQRSVFDNHNGKYSVTYLVPRGGNLRSLKVLVTVNGLPVTSSPFLATVKAERVRECWRRLALFGEEGTGPGKFCRPWGVALCRLPLVREPGHKAVGGETVTSTPVQSKPFFSVWNGPGGVPPANETPARRRDYVIAVADRSNNRIQLLKLSIGVDSGPGAGGGPFGPGGSLRGSPENIGGVEISVMHVFGSGPGTRNGQFDRPAGIAINGNLGQIVVVDKDNHRIQSFDMTGNFLFKFGEKGSRAGQFCYPWDVAICPQTSMVLVSDTRNRRIQLFTHFGQYLWHCGQPLDSPRGVAFLSPERYIVSDFNKHRLLIIDRNEGGGGGHSSAGMLNGQSILSTLGPAHSSSDLSSGGGSSVGGMMVACGINSKYIGFGEGSAWGEFLRPQGLAVSRASLGGGGNFHPNGGLLQHHHSHNSHHHHHLQQLYKNTQIICADSRNSRIAVWNSLNQSFEYIYEEPSNNNSSTSASSSSKSSEHSLQQSYPPGLMSSNQSNSATASVASSSSSSSSATATTTTATGTSTAFDRPSGLAMVDDILAVVDFGNNRLQVFQRSVTTVS